MKAVLAPALLLAAFSLLWAGIERYGVAAQLPAEQVVWLRYATHLMVLTLVCWRRRATLIRTHRPWVQFFRSFLMFGMPLCFIAAATRMPLNTALAVFWIAPVLVLIMDREAASTAWNWVAVLAGFAGTALLLHPGRGGFTPRVLVFPVGMALCFAGYLALTRMLKSEPETANLFYTAFWVLIAMSFPLIHVWQRPTAVGLQAASLIGISGLLALYCLDVALKYTPPARMAAVFYLQPAFAALLQFALPSAALAGIVLICGAVAVQLHHAHSACRRGAAA